MSPWQPHWLLAGVPCALLLATINPQLAGKHTHAHMTLEHDSSRIHASTAILRRILSAAIDSDSALWGCVSDLSNFRSEGPSFRPDSGMEQQAYYIVRAGMRICTDTGIG